MRSVTAVLRITHEQLDARGHLGAYPRIAAGVGLVTIGLGFVGTVVSEPLQAQLRASAMAFAAVTAGLTLIVWQGRGLRRACAYQEREIRRMSRASLERILDHSFPRKPLQREHVAVVQDLLRGQSPSPLGELVGLGEA